MAGIIGWTSGMGKWPPWPLGLAVAVLLGAALRLVWVRDIEYKLDEAVMFYLTQESGRAELSPWLGLPSSAGVPNPGMNVWIFCWLGKLAEADDPTGLARAVQVLNIAAILLLLAFIFRVVSREEREAWLWAVALGSLNPLIVLFHRKIWQPSIFPLFTLLMLAGWWHRDRRWGAFLWGLVGACLGQIQMAGFFFAAGFAAWAVLFDRKRTAWWCWLWGSCLGSVPLIPWGWYLLTQYGGRSLSTTRLGHVLELKHWIRWFTEPFGISVAYSLHEDFWDYLGCPHLVGRPTYLVGLVHGLLLVTAVVILTRGGLRLWQDRSRWRELWIGRHSPSAFTQNAALWGFGIVLTLSALSIHRHYLLVAFPFTFLWVARLALGPSATVPALRWGRSLLLVLCVAEFLVSASFLGYIHANQRQIQGDYGIPYGAQHPPLPLSAEQVRSIMKGELSCPPRLGERHEAASKPFPLGAVP